MAIYLIDSENMTFTNPKGELLIDLKFDDTVYILANGCMIAGLVGKYSDLVALGYDIRFIKTHSGISNALDFQLVLLLGRFSALHPDETFYIVSNDKGFKSLLPMASTLRIKLGIWDGDLAKSFHKDVEVLKSTETDIVEKPNDETSEPKPAPLLSKDEFKKLCDSWHILPCSYFRNWNAKTFVSMSTNKKYGNIVSWLVARNLNKKMARTVYFTICSGGFKMTDLTVERLANELKMPRTAIIKLNTYLLKQTNSKYGNPTILTCPTLPKL